MRSQSTRALSKLRVALGDALSESTSPGRPSADLNEMKDTADG
jgi:hypothetical protein